MENEKYTADDYFRESTSINPESIHEEYVRLSADLAFWGERYTEAYKRYLNAKQDHELVVAKTTLLVRLELSGKPTEATVSANVAINDDVQLAKMNLIEADAEKVRMKCRVEAIMAKKDMLVSLGAHVRKEMEGDPLIRAKFAARHDEWAGGDR